MNGKDFYCILSGSINGQCLGSCIHFKESSCHSKFSSYIEWRCKYTECSLSSSNYPSKMKKEKKNVLHMPVNRRLSTVMSVSPQRHTCDEGVSISGPLSVYEGCRMLETSGNKQGSTRALTPSLFNQVRGWPWSGTPRSPLGNGNADRSALLVGVKERKERCSLKRGISNLFRGEPTA